MITIEGVVKNNTKTDRIDDGEWGMDINNDFIECCDFLAGLDTLLSKFNYDESTIGMKIKLIIE